jgi:hypothetical protein
MTTTLPRRSASAARFVTSQHFRHTLDSESVRLQMLTGQTGLVVAAAKKDDAKTNTWRYAANPYTYGIDRGAKRPKARNAATGGGVTRLGK